VEQPDVPPADQQVVAHRQCPQPVALIRAQLVAPPDHLGRRLVAPHRQVIVPVAADIDVTHLVAPIDDLSASWTLSHEVAEVDDPIDTARLDVVEHRLKCGEVAVHVADQGNFLQRHTPDSATS
jgi:hypothetical protein